MATLAEFLNSIDAEEFAEVEAAIAVAKAQKAEPVKTGKKGNPDALAAYRAKKKAEKEAEPVAEVRRLKQVVDDAVASVQEVVTGYYTCKRSEVLAWFDGVQPDFTKPIDWLCRGVTPGRKVNECDSVAIAVEGPKWFVILVVGLLKANGLLLATTKKHRWAVSLQETRVDSKVVGLAFRARLYDRLVGFTGQVAVDPDIERKAVAYADLEAKLGKDGLEALLATICK